MKVVHPKSNAVVVTNELNGKIFLVSALIIQVIRALSPLMTEGNLGLVQWVQLFDV